MSSDDQIVYFAEANFRGQKKRFGIKKNDRRKHMYVIGKTGMGKTTMLENLAVQDIQNGEGLAFIDPHGDTAYRLLDFVPKERIKDVIYFDPADTDFPIGFNIMENVDAQRRHFVASGLMSVFKKIFGPDVWSARMEYILSNTVLALLEYPGSTLLNINAMLSVKEFRKKVVEHISDPVVKAFWTQEFAKYTERFAAEATPAIQNKVGQFTSNSLIRNIVGQIDSAFDVRKIMDEKKILIMNLAKGKVGEENMRLIGTMLVTKLYLAAMSRVDQPEEEKRADFFLYVDEFQNFATESFANILAEARKYRLSLILANQYMEQLDETVRDAVIGNVGTMVTFRVGATDAEFLEKEFLPEFTVQDICNLGFANIYLKLMIDGIASRPFSATTLGPITGGTKDALREELIASSRALYGSARTTVEGNIVAWQEGIADDASSGSKEKDKEKKPADPNRKMYDALCAVCGEKIQVPFEPDSRRPVFCKNHLGVAETFKAGQKAAEQARAPRPREEQRGVDRRSPHRFDSRGQSRPPTPERREEGFVSLRDLKQPHRPPSQKSRPPFDKAQGKQRPDNSNIEALRAALKKTQEQKNSGPPAQAGTLNPGETLEL